MESRKSLSPSRRFLVLTLVCALGFATGLWASYLGSGKHPTNNLKWYYYGYTSGGGASYWTPASNGMSVWSSQTDLNLSYSSNFDVAFVTDWYSGTGWAGLAVCYNNYGQNWLNDPSVFDDTLAYCYAYNDRYDMDGASQSRRQNLFMHEAGHCYSLAHRNYTSSIMYPYVQAKTTLNSTDISLINSRY